MKVRALCAATLVLLLTNCSKPSPEEAEFQKRFDREAVFVKTCGVDPGIASAVPLKVYRLDGALWFSDRGRWRKIEATIENVCDLLDVDPKHRQSSEPTPMPVVPTPAGVAAAIVETFRGWISTKPADKQPRERGPS